MKRTKKSLIALLLTLILCAGMLPGAALADYDDAITVSVQIYVNGEWKASDTVTSAGFPELEYGSLPIGYLYGDCYGVYESGSCNFNGAGGFFFCFDGENVSVFSSGFECPAPGDQISVQLNYRDERAAAPVVYGTLTLNVCYQNGNPAEGAEIRLDGRKGAETQSFTVVSNASGIAVADGLDCSFDWTFSFNGATYPVFFDGSNNDRCDLSLPNPPEPVGELNGTVEVYLNGSLFSSRSLTASGNTEESVRGGAVRSGYATTADGIQLVEMTAAQVELNGSEIACSFQPTGSAVSFAADETMAGEMTVRMYFQHTEEARSHSFNISVTHQLAAAPGGVSVDGVITGVDTILFSGTTAACFGETIQVAQLWNVGSEQLIGSAEAYGNSGLIQYGNALYRAAGSYLSGGDSSSFRGSVITGGAAFRDRSFSMIFGDVTLILDYVFVDYVSEEPAEEPVTEEPAAEEPAAEEPVAEEPAVEEPAVEEPVAEEPVAEEPVAEEPAAEVPAAEEPAAEEPAAEEPAAEEPVAEEPAAEEPVAEAPAAEAPVNTTPVIPEAAVVEEVAYAAPATPESPVVENLVHVAPAVPMAAPEIITEPELPMAAPAAAAWSVLNLILSVLTVLFCLLKVLVNNRKDDEERSEDDKRSENRRYLAVIPAAASVILFLLTENLRNPMCLLDRWTPVMLVILAVEALFLVLSRRKDEQLQRAGL